MLSWIEKEVESPYGAVSTLHWAVPDASRGVAHHSNPEAYRHDNSYYVPENENPYERQAEKSAEADADTALAVQLESAEDQLGAVLWNSNSTALGYLHRRVFASGDSAAAEADEPLRGKCVVELGAGVGCLGIALAMAGARVVVSDIKELVPLMAHNVKRNAARIRRRSGGKGRCAALAWKWGPTASLNPKKILKQQAQQQKKKEEGRDPAEALAAMLATLTAQPSAPYAECLSLLQDPSEQISGDMPRIDYVVLCDALYGNPNDWPALLYTLSEILKGNPTGCTVVNFCEQRINNVEGAFLKLLDEENETNSGGDSGSSADETVTAAQSAAEVLRTVLRVMRGAYRWRYEVEAVAEGASDLDMPIRAMRLWWALPEACARPGVRRPREADDASDGVAPAAAKARH